MEHVEIKRMERFEYEPEASGNAVRREKWEVFVGGCGVGRYENREEAERHAKRARRSQERFEEMLEKSDLPVSGLRF